MLKIGLAERRSVYRREERKGDSIGGERQTAETCTNGLRLFARFSRGFHLEELQSRWQLHLHPGKRTLRAQGTVRMKVHITLALLPPANVSEDALLPDRAGEPLDGGTGVLMLAGARVDVGPSSSARTPPRIGRKSVSTRLIRLRSRIRAAPAPRHREGCHLQSEQ